MDKKLRKHIKDVRTKRAADVDVDHLLVATKLTMKPRDRSAIGQAAVQKFNTTCLQDFNKLSEFNMAFSTKFDNNY